MTENTCMFDGCKHSNESHQDGSCWEVTEPDKTGIERYCKCDSMHGQNLRLFKNLKFMVPQAVDMMLTKRCHGCGEIVLLRRDESLCGKCRPPYPAKLKELPDFIIARPVSQEDLQKML